MTEKKERTETVIPSPFFFYLAFLLQILVKGNGDDALCRIGKGI